VEAAGPASSWRCIGGALQPGQTAAFHLARAGRAVPAFIVNHRGRHYAYVNRCPHAGTALDERRNDFWSADGRHLECGTHGAVFEPETGICVEGPCPGARLTGLVVGRDGDALIVTCPE
jgi:nitrite reductase/ring-hydroxylating ferredoxin subunit